MPSAISPLDIDLGLLQEIAAEASRHAFMEVVLRDGTVTGLIDGELVTISAREIHERNRLAEKTTHRRAKRLGKTDQVA